MVISNPVSAGSSAGSLSAAPLLPRRPVAQEMEAELHQGLCNHLQMELMASYTYWSLGVWFIQRELNGFAGYARAESDGERIHAGLFVDYLVARSQPVELAALPQPRQTWTNVEDVLVSVFEMEAEVTTSLQQLYSLAERCGDYRTSIFLDPMIKSQVDAENEVAHLLAQVRHCGTDFGALMILDQSLNAPAAAAA
ncbi:ferritin [Synechococcus sp. BSF8S]|uniref:ferritin n=2 Tax=Cyanophyceae TaxID=3028117 RepID=UPI001626C0AC|nr:ferritin [Synechococcus sp. BSA11S]MBC1260923.1 ferritin [Synechococcus sp. BSF8S]MBC1263599.1 ferritin [Synechococcus sp. BSA11S]